MEEKREFIRRVWPKMERIEQWCDEMRKTTPVTHEVEVVSFLTMAEAAAEVYYDVNPRE